ncbi:MAG TPA: LmbU family transcriptional regulator [Actinocrinis sp.]|nr:LmbU family transcriptional regulator [Actinocrinis sp.]
MNERRDRTALSPLAAQAAVGAADDQAGRDPVAQKQILVTGVGLLIPPAVEFCAWEQAGVKIARIAECSSWCLGDWLVYGEHKYADRYRQVIAAARLDYQTLRNYAWVARRFELARRREELSFQHHAEVAALPAEEQDRWLDLSAGQSWSRNELRRRLRSGREPGRLSARTVALPRMRIAPEHLARWRGAAERMNQDLEEWVVATLEDGARQILTAGGGQVAELEA